MDRVVLDPQTDEVSHVIIREGRLFHEDKIVPISAVADASADRVTLNRGEHDLMKLAKFEDSYYVPARAEDFRGGDYAPAMGRPAMPLYGYPPVGATWWSAGVETDVGDPKYTKQIQENIPEGMIAVKEGARVISVEGEHVGNVEDIFTDAATNHVTHLIISQGLVFKERKLIPSNWIKLPGEDDVILTVKTATVHELPAYKG